MKDKSFKQKVIDGDVRLNLEQAGNFLKDKNETIKEDARKKDFPISIALPDDRQRYLMYCISLLDSKKYPEFVLLLKCRVEGYSNKKIARVFNVPVEVVEVMEIEAKKRVMNAITIKKARCVPLVGNG